MVFWFHQGLILTYGGCMIPLDTNFPSSTLLQGLLLFIKSSFYFFTIPTMIHTFNLCSNFWNILLSMCVGYSQIRIWHRISLHPIKNSIWVLGTNLEGTKFNKYITICRENLHNKIDSDVNSSLIWLSHNTRYCEL